MSGRRRTCVFLILAAAVALVFVVALGCGGSGGKTATTVGATAPVPATTTTTSVVVLDFLSTFQAKDPFIQQVITTTATTKGTGTTTTTRSSTTTTRSSTTGTGATVTTSPYPTQTTSGYHYLKLLSISTINSVAVCTFEVDRVVYQDKKVGDVVSTSWGQIKVLAINTQNQTVTFQHGSETRILSVGQQIVK